MLFSLLSALVCLPALAEAAAQTKPAKAPSAKIDLLDTLPSQPVEPLTPELLQLTAEFRKNPDDVALAVALSRAYYQHAVREGELRFIGYARAVLAPWWTMENPPLEVLVMRANLRQYVHQFPRALEDLDAVLARQPDHVQALAIRAAVHTVGADYAAARADCARLKPLTNTLIGFACAASLDSLTGQAQASYDALSSLLARTPRIRPVERLWVVTRLAEMAERIGNHAAAEQRFRQALFIDPRDQYVLAAYADFLLDQKRPAEVVSLLKDRTSAEHLLLRLVLAEQTLDAPSLAAHKQMVEEAFASARREGHPVHEQEESRFVLHVLDQPERALKLASSNWQVQRESRDARVLLDAAVATGNRQAAEPVLQWLRDSGIEVVKLRVLAQALEEKTTPKAGAHAS